MSISKVPVVACLALCASCLAFDAAAMAPASCFQKAGGQYHIDPLLLHAIAQVESGHRSEVVHINRDGSKDYGIMQVNEANLTAEQRARVISDPCFGVEKGAEILAGMISRFGYTWAAVGGYNAGVSNKRHSARARYAQKIWSRYRLLVARRHQDQQGERL
jgi:soluble lytic murein transglycosylase-like protein